MLRHAGKQNRFASSLQSRKSLNDLQEHDVIYWNEKLFFGGIMWPHPQPPLSPLSEAGRGGENARRSRKSIGISSLACSEMWVKMRLDAHATFEYPVSQSIKATSR